MLRISIRQVGRRDESRRIAPKSRLIIEKIRKSKFDAPGGPVHVGRVALKNGSKLFHVQDGSLLSVPHESYCALLARVCWRISNNMNIRI